MYSQVSFFYVFFSPNTFTKKRTVLPAIGIDLTCLQIHTALTPVSREKKKIQEKGLFGTQAQGSQTAVIPTVSIIQTDE